MRAHPGDHPGRIPCTSEPWRYHLAGDTQTATVQRRGPEYKGIEAANGGYIAYLDSDDVMDRTISPRLMTT